MSADEIDYNPFYRLLQERYRSKYDQAICNCWTVCVPTSTSLRGIDITEKFVDVHLLKKSSLLSKCCVSSDENGMYTVEVGDDTVKLISAPFPNFESYEVKILQEEIAYNKEFKNYTILIIDKPLSPEFNAKPGDEGTEILDKDITSLNEAIQFFSNFLLPHEKKGMSSLNESVECLIPSMTPKASLGELSALIHETVASQWNSLLCTQSLKRQRDARFQGLLSTAIETYIVSHLHEHVFPIICSTLSMQDQRIYSKAKEFCELGITADQLGAPDDFAVPVPAAVVELASIDCLTSPVEKLACLRTTMDLIMAEIKGAIVDAHCVLPSGNEPWTPPPQPSSDDLIPLIMSVLVQAKPLHLAANIYYMENFQWTLEPNNALSYGLVVFKAAVQGLFATNVSNLRPKNKKILRELSLEDLIKVTGEVDGRFNRGGDRRNVPEEEREPFSPLDRQLEHLTSMIEASTRELDEEESLSIPTQNPSSPTTTGGLMAALQSNFGTCLSKQEGVQRF